jgi:flavin-dependent dehydrogenase/NAD-dependent dihydropyrimidine dehydrogenase PreA subunit
MNNAIQLDRERCTGCGICAKICPQIVFSQKAPKAIPEIAVPERCFGCLACEEDCPDLALRVLRLPEGVTPEQIPAPAKDLQFDRIYDLVIIGAGPAGLGAAIRGRRLGLSVAMVERLPSPKRSHHPDGGLLFSAPDIYTLTESGGGFLLKELDFTIGADLILERLYDFVFMGPDGTSTKPATSAWKGFPVVNKDRLVERLAARAQEDGAAIAYNTRARSIEKPAAGREAGVILETGATLRGRVVLCAEGCTGQLAEKAGVPVNQQRVGWSYAALAEAPPVEGARLEAGFFVGPLRCAPGNPSGVGYWSNGSHLMHVSWGPLQKRKPRELSRPVSEVLNDFLANDRRFGASGRTPGRAALPSPGQLRGLDGCRVMARRLPSKATAGGLIAVGDAITSCGMMTNLVALKTGDLAAQAAAAAIRKGTPTAAALAGFDRRVFKLSMVQGMKWMHNLLIEAPLELPEAKLDELFGTLKSLGLAKLMSGGVGGMLALAGFYLRNSFTLLRRKDLRKFLVP